MEDKSPDTGELNDWVWTDKAQLHLGGLILRILIYGE
jgi:hypothetical protein